MKVIIAGSRCAKLKKLRPAYENALVKAIGDSLLRIDEVVCGCADGVDTLGEIWAKEQKIPVKLFPAQWAAFGKSAGFRRNVEMAQYADALIAIWDGQSPGTRHMINQMVKLRKRVHVALVEADPKLLEKQPLWMQRIVT